MTIEQYRELLGCEHAEIITYSDKKFLKIGKTCNTRDDSQTCWTRNGERFDFEYIAWIVVASGANDEELEASARKYKRLRGLTWEEYFADHVLRCCRRYKEKERGVDEPIQF